MGTMPTSEVRVRSEVAANSLVLDRGRPGGCDRREESPASGVAAGHLRAARSGRRRAGRQTVGEQPGARDSQVGMLAPTAATRQSERRFSRVRHLRAARLSAAPGYHLVMAGSARLVSEQEFIELLEAAPQATPDDVSKTFDGRRLDSKEAVLAWWAEVEPLIEADRAEDHLPTVEELRG